MKERSFWKQVRALALPVALQSMLQSSFSMVDQIMIGQLGETWVAGVGLAGKFASVYSVVLAAIGAAAGILLSQYLGQQNEKEARRGFFVSLWMGLGFAGAFTVLCLTCAGPLMGAYTRDEAARQAGAQYLTVLSGSFLPLAGATMLSTAFRCAEKPRLPLYASLFSACLNSVGNYLLIFGKLGFPAMGAAGAAVATVLAQWANCLTMLALAPRHLGLLKRQGAESLGGFRWRQYGAMLVPLLVCEGMWSLGENVYAVIYGHMGTEACAAMTLTNPIQGLVIGALCGLGQAAGVIVGKRLGSGDEAGARRAGAALMACGAVGAGCLSGAVLLLRGAYLSLYRVSPAVEELTRQILLAYAVIAPFKILNMILGGGILRSGGRTKYVMAIDLLGTWGLGIPLGLLGAFVLRLSIPWVYFLLSLEEIFRFLLSVWVFRRGSWQNQLAA